MPPRKRPKRLATLCIVSINQYINELILYMQYRYGLGCITVNNTKLKLIQNYLCENICPSMLDNLLNSFNPPQILNENMKLMLLKIYMHRDMVSFQPMFRLPSKEDFYEWELTGLTKLVVLNLRMVCTDEILEVVGRNCPLLEIVDIVSKIGSECNKARHQLNALKLKFFVSDVGLKHLHNCVRLKRITMNTVIRTNCGGKKITHDGIRDLLNNLPKLQYINYSDMGIVLKGLQDNKTLNLLQLHDNHTEPEHIELFSKHCPFLKCLCLIIPTTSTDVNMPGKCCNALAKSNLDLKSLALGMFPIGTNFLNYLSLKGHNLTSLCLIHKSTINLNVVVSIALCCPNLKSLDLCRLQPSNSDKYVTLQANEKTTFKYLETLKIIGSSWDPYIIYPLCLFNSPFLKDILLINEHYNRLIDDLIVTMMSKNKFDSLRFATVLDGFDISIDTLIKFVLHCENLKAIKLKKGNSYDYYLGLIKEENNLDLNISVESSRNFGECFCFS